MSSNNTFIFFKNRDEIIFNLPKYIYAMPKCLKNSWKNSEYTYWDSIDVYDKMKLWNSAKKKKNFSTWYQYTKLQMLKLNIYFT